MTAAGRDPAFIWLALLPLALLGIDSDWIFSGPHRDAWIYYGYYENAVFYLKRFPDLYYSSRLAVALPGFVAHHAFPPLAANLLLHLVLYWTAAVSFYLVVKDLLGPRAALLASVALGCHPFFLLAIGWNYVDGFGIAYYLLMLQLVTWATRSPSWRWLLLAAGATATALISTNIFYAVFLPTAAGQFWVLNRERARIPSVAAALWAALGTAGLLLILGSFTWAIGGRFFYLNSSLQFAADNMGAPNIFRDATYAWLPEAVWLVFPAVTFAGSVVVIGRALMPGSPNRDRFLLWSQVQFVYASLLFLYCHVLADMAVLQHFYYSTLLIPAAFLAFAGQIAVPAGFGGARLAAIAGVVAVLHMAPRFVLPMMTLPPKVTPFGPHAGTGPGDRTGRSCDELAPDQGNRRRARRLRLPWGVAGPCPAGGRGVPELRLARQRRPGAVPADEPGNHGHRPFRSVGNRASLV